MQSDFSISYAHVAEHYWSYSDLDHVALNCTSPPYPETNNDKGSYDWDGKNLTYLHEVIYR